MVISLSLWPPRRRPNTTGSRTAPKPFLVNSQWVLIKDLLRDPPKSKLGGRPRVAARACLEGILWILRTGARWQARFHFLNRARTIPQSFNLLAAIAGMDRSRRLGKSVAAFAEKT